MDIKNYFIMAVFALVLIVPLSYAFGVSAEYDTNRKLQLLPGQSKDFKIYLQNMAGEKEDITLKASITAGQDIATIADKEPVYDVPFGRKDVVATVKVQVPENAKIGTRYDINITFKQVSKSDNEMLKMTGAIKVNVPVFVESPEKQAEIAEPEQEQKTSFANYAIIAIVIVVLVAIGFALRKKKR